MAHLVRAWLPGDYWERIGPAGEPDPWAAQETAKTVSRLPCVTKAEVTRDGAVITTWMDGEPFDT